jgi:hypothetical protein
MRYRFGSTICEVADATGLSVRTVERELSLARAWLERETFGSGESCIRPSVSKTC